MSGKRRHCEREARRRAIEERAAQAALSAGVPVDLEALAPNNSWNPPEFVNRGFYVDVPFCCQSCGKEQVWTAAQQKWWYEVAKGDVFSTATRCRPCRHAEKARREAAQRTSGDPNPYKNPGLLIAKIRSEIEPKLLSAGYRLVDRSQHGVQRILFLEYARSDGLFVLSWDQHAAQMTARLLTERMSDVRVLASAGYWGFRSPANIEDRLASFMQPIRSFLENLGEVAGEPGV
jgi:hypothetical protein